MPWKYMKPKKIKRLRRIIKSPGYFNLRWRWMWKESDIWWNDWLLSRNNEDMKNCIMFRRKAEWYSKRIEK